MNLINKVLAQTTAPEENAWNILQPTGAHVGTTIPTLVGQIVTIILMIAGALAVIYLIYSGILYITAAGNPDNAKKGQQGLINAVIGIVVIILAYIIIRAVVNTAATI